MSHNHKKKYGQNFLNGQEEVLEKIMEVASVSSEDNILEIGPGEGALTKLMIEAANHVYSVEIDSDLEKKLRNYEKTYDNFTLFMEDFLNFDFNKKIDKEVKVVANIPYYITSPIIDKLISHRDYISEIYIMVQKEVGERICAKEGKKRSILTLAVEYFGEASYLFTIPKEFFFPIPKVDSAFIGIKLSSKERLDTLPGEEVFFKYVKGAFSNKRKNLSNNLTTFGYSKDIIKEKLESVGISPTARAESLSFDDFLRLIAVFEEKIN